MRRACYPSRQRQLIQTKLWGKWFMIHIKTYFSVKEFERLCFCIQSLKEREIEHGTPGEQCISKRQWGRGLGGGEKGVSVSQKPGEQSGFFMKQQQHLQSHHHQTACLSAQSADLSLSVAAWQGGLSLQTLPSNCFMSGGIMLLPVMVLIYPLTREATHLIRMVFRSKLSPWGATASGDLYIKQLLFVSYGYHFCKREPTVHSMHVICMYTQWANSLGW